MSGLTFESDVSDVSHRGTRATGLEEASVSATAERTEEFIRLFVANQRRIYGLVAAMVPNAADADDVFQDVSTKLWQKFHEFEPGTDFAAWGLQFARYTVLKHHEQRRRNGQLAFGDDVLEMIADETCEVIPELNRRQQALRECVQKLPEHSRRLLAERYESGLKTCREVGESLGRSVEAVYKALSRLHESLLRCIEKTLAAEDSR